ncbi:hypothetical protein ACFYP4_00485 [Streptomyces sp. NPDC005551]|uniref:hypothetical protein n=1 Tax=unclassified Streptomyces TaxID=2593676 RepID=UPI0034088369
MGLHPVSPSPPGEGTPSSGVPLSAGDGDREGSGDGVRSGEGFPWWPDRASPTVVPALPLKLSPDTSSYVVMPAMVTPKTSAAATSGRFQPVTRARWTVPAPNSCAGAVGSAGSGLLGRDPVARFGRPWTFTSRICSPVRLKKCWKTVPPHVAIALTTPAPRIVPYTPKYEASLAATTAATALPATCGTLRSTRFLFGSCEVSDVSPIPEPCLPFPYLAD